MQKAFPVLLLSLLAACGQSTPGNEPETAIISEAHSLPAGVTLVEEFSGSEKDFSIPFSKFVLDNGLTVILHEDHSDPMVHVDVNYHVGSAREVPGRSGFAHFFEHMMFEGSENVDRGDFSKTISNAGGALNGSTTSDRTFYYETLPVNQLETALWLEADRMGLLLQAVTQEQFDIQRAAVKNERGQRIDNQPYGRISETLMKNLYPPEHPYSWPVIGWIEDLDAATLNDLKGFFLRWYGPNNAILSIGGDIDRDQTLEWVVKYFGPIPSGPDAEKLEKMPGRIEQDRYVTLEDNIHLPAIAVLIPTVYFRHPDEAPLDAAAKIIGQGRASLLYQRLVQTGRAVSVNASHACRELACEMMFIVIQNPASGETLAEMETAIRETLREFAERGVNDDDLQKFIAGFESGQIFGMQSVAGKVSNLAVSEVLSGDPRLATDDIQRYANVTKQDVVRTFRQYIEESPAVILSVVPNGNQDLAARQQNFDHSEMMVPKFTPPTVSPPKSVAEPAMRTWRDTFDRSEQPQPGVNPLVDLPLIWDTKLANGVRLLAVPNTETPTITIQAKFGAGQRDEPPGKAGLASLTATLMREATKQRSAAQFSEALERIGASVGVSSGQYDTTVTLNVLSKHVNAGMTLMMERILEPVFSEEDFTRLKTRTMESLMQARKSGPALAGRALGAVLAGPEHPLSYPARGLPSTLAAISLQDVKDFYATHIPSRLQGVLVSTSLPKEEILIPLAPLGELRTVEFLREPIENLPQISGRTIYLVNKEGAAQSTLRMAHPSLKYDALGDFYLASLMNFNLGGNFDSRINLNLREDKGYTYGISSGFSGGRELGSFRISSEINKESTAAAITEVFMELQNYAADGMTGDEFQYLQNAIGQRDARRYETPGAKLGLMSQILRHDLPLDFRKQQKSLLRETDRETLNALAHRLIDPENMAIVVVGDNAAIRPQLEALDTTIRTLDEDGLEVGQR
jgi:zinc protease